MTPKLLSELAELSFEEFWNYCYWLPREKAYAAWVSVINTYGV